MRAVTLLLSLIFAALLWNILIRCVERWQLSDQRRALDPSMKRLRAAYAESSARKRRQIYVRCVWLVILGIVSALVECV